MVVRRNEVLGILIDSGLIEGDTTSPISVDFLNGKVSLAAGPVVIAHETGAHLLAMLMWRSPDWRHQVLEISPVLVDADTVGTYRRCLAIIEAAIHRYPAQWRKWSLGELATLGLVRPEVLGIRRRLGGGTMQSKEQAQFELSR